MQKSPSGGNPRSSPDMKPIGNGYVKDRQVATRPQTTEVRSDNVATAQVHHYDPEPRLRVLLSNANSGGLKQSACVVGDLPKKEARRIQEGWPLPCRNRIRPWTGRTMEAK